MMMSIFHEGIAVVELKMASHSQMQKEPHSIHQAHMEKYCEICGDIDFQEAIITWYQCKNVEVHQYCVLGYYEDAPVDWCCEECDIGKGVLYSSSGLENEQFEGSKLNASAKICQSTLQPKKHSPGGSTIPEHRSPDAMNESRRMNSFTTHSCDPALVPSWKENNSEICGDIGFQEAVTCYQCKNVDVHQYCVLGYYEDAPVDWCCEECDIGKGVMYSSSGLENE